MGSPGVAQAPMTDTDTAGTVECEVQAGTSDAEECGMDASDDFEVFEETAVLDLRVDGMRVLVGWPESASLFAGPHLGGVALPRGNDGGGVSQQPSCAGHSGSL